MGESVLQRDSTLERRVRPKLRQRRLQPGQTPPNVYFFTRCRVADMTFFVNESRYFRVVFFFSRDTLHANAIQHCIVYSTVSTTYSNSVRPSVHLSVAFAVSKRPNGSSRFLDRPVPPCAVIRGFRTPH